MFKDLLGDGSRIGLFLDYKVQLKPRGIAEAFILAEDFIWNSSCSLILGDNIFYGQSFTKLLQSAMRNNLGAEIFTYSS